MCACRELEVMRADAKEPLLVQVAELQEELAAVKVARDKAVQALDALQGEARQHKHKARWAGDTVTRLERCACACSVAHAMLQSSLHGP